MEQIYATSEIGQSYLKSNQNQGQQIPSLQCRFHKNQDILYLNTDFSGKRMLCCQFCIVSEELESKKLLPLQTLKYEGDLLEYMWSFKENKEALKLYQQIINTNFQEEREKIIIQCKNLRVKLDSQIEQLEIELILYNKMLENQLLSIQQFSNQFYEQICQEMNQFKANDIDLENKMRGYLLDFDLNKNKIFELLKNIQSILDEGPSKIAINYEKQIEYFQAQLKKAEENYDSYKISKLIQQKNKNLQDDDDDDDDDIQKMIAQHDIFNSNKEILFNQQLISVCQRCQQRTIEVQQQNKYIILQKSFIKDITIEVFLKSTKDFHYLLKVPLINCTQKDIKQIVNLQFENLIDLQQLIVVVNNKIVEDNQIIDIEKIETIQVFQISDLKQDEEETILFQINICKTDSLSTDLLKRKQQISKAISQQTRYIQMNRQQSESDLMGEILTLYQNSFKNLLIGRQGLFSYRQAEKISQNLNYLKEICSIFAKSGKDLAQTKLFRNFDQYSIQEVYIFILENDYKHFQLNPGEKKINSAVTKKLSQIQFNRRFSCYDDQRLHNYSLLCSNCQSIQEHRITKQCIIDSDSIVLDFSNIPYMLQQSEFKNLLMIQKNKNYYQLSLCIIKNYKQKLQILQLDQKSSLWRIGNDQNLLDEDSIVSLIPQILVYQKKEQQEQNSEQNQALE